MEVLALQASPVLGIVLGGFSIELCGLIRPGLLLFGSLALTAHIFVFNDWAGLSGDMRDSLRAPLVFTRQGIRRLHVARGAAALLFLAIAIFTFIGSLTLLLGGAIAALSFLYSSSPRLGKSTPIAASMNHLTGGSLHFLLGYTLFHPLDTKGIIISLFFGLVFAGGHLNQEVRDYQGDLISGIRTSAVVFGNRRTFLASLLVFSAAYALLAFSAAFEILPRLLLWSTLLWPLHVAWSLKALRRGLGFETALWMQRRYRVLFGLIGIAMLAL